MLNVGALELQICVPGTVEVHHDSSTPNKLLNYELAGYWRGRGEMSGSGQSYSSCKGETSS